MADLKGVAKKGAKATVSIFGGLMNVMSYATKIIGGPDLAKSEKELVDTLYSTATDADQDKIQRSARAIGRKIGMSLDSMTSKANPLDKAIEDYMNKKGK